jgi:hypothetical protein
VSQFRIEKRRVEAALTLTTGATVRGCFFLAATAASGAGPERVGDLLNAEPGFFPFEVGGDAPHIALYNRAHLVAVVLAPEPAEAQLEAGYGLAAERCVRMLLSNGRSVEGRVRVYRPAGHDRLSAYTRAPGDFRYLETAHGTLIVNTAHIVELEEMSA